MDRSSPHQLPSYYVYTRALLFPHNSHRLPYAHHLFPATTAGIYHLSPVTTNPKKQQHHHHGLFTIQRRRAGAHVQGYREEAGWSFPPFFPQHLGITDENGIPQMQDFMRLYSGLVERCFNACAQDFTSKALTTNEVCPFFFFLYCS